jgi:hypothetical protein
MYKSKFSKETFEVTSNGFPSNKNEKGGIG